MFELVSRYHPDKLADIISDAIVDKVLEEDEDAHLAIETMLCDDDIFIAGEAKSDYKFNSIEISKEALADMDFPENRYEIHDLVRRQSPEIDRAVSENEGAGDQGFVFGFATNDEEYNYLPPEIRMCQDVMDRITEREDVFEGDAKILTDGRNITLSACHYPIIPLESARDEMKAILSECGFGLERYHLLLNPAGAWTIGGSKADTGLTGRKIVCDAYGAWCPVGGGALSGKDLTKVDRSGAYYARLLAKDILRDYGFEKVYTRLSFAIGDPRLVTVGAWYESKGEIKPVPYTYHCVETVKDMIEAVKIALGGASFSEIAKGNHMLWL